MTAAIRLLPNMEARMDRITAQQRRANEDRELNLITARAVLNNAAMHRTSDVRNAIILLESRGDGRGDLIMAHEATGLLKIRERREAHAAAADETGLSIALRFRSRWLEIIAYAALIAGVMLYMTGWL